MRMPPYQLGIQFVQIGVDDEASAHLTSLDDDLREKHGFVPSYSTSRAQLTIVDDYSIRDLVDTTLFDVNTVRSFSRRFRVRVRRCSRAVERADILRLDTSNRAKSTPNTS